MINTLTYKGMAIGRVKGERMTINMTAEALGLTFDEYLALDAGENNLDVVWDGEEFCLNNRFDGRSYSSETVVWENGRIVKSTNPNGYNPPVEPLIFEGEISMKVNL